MTTPLEANFDDYKKAEAKALEILKEMKKSSVRPMDIELALLVAIFELHRGSLKAENIVRIIEGHLATLGPFYNE
ncbi:MAG TPA: hypothetical protein VK041_08005 [Opitutales bacterium]|nr:hypothetical protein [Opitutales bacterium]